MSVLRPMGMLPDLNRATVLLVGTEDALLQKLAESMLKGDCASELRIHLANSLPLPSNVNQPRIDLIVFVINLHSRYSLQKVEESLNHVDSTFFLGKVCFLVTGAGQESHCSIHRDTVMRLAHTYRSPLFFCDLQVESFRATIAQRLVRVLQMCAGHVPGVSALNLLSLLRIPESPHPRSCEHCCPPQVWCQLHKQPLLVKTGQGLTDPEVVCSLLGSRDREPSN